MIKNFGWIVTKSGVVLSASSPPCSYSKHLPFCRCHLDKPTETDTVCLISLLFLTLSNPNVPDKYFCSIFWTLPCFRGFLTVMMVKLNCKLTHPITAFLHKFTASPVASSACRKKRKKHYSGHHRETFFKSCQNVMNTVRTAFKQTIKFYATPSLDHHFFFFLGCLILTSYTLWTVS